MRGFSHFFITWLGSVWSAFIAIRVKQQWKLIRRESDDACDDRNRRHRRQWVSEWTSESLGWWNTRPGIVRRQSKERRRQPEVEIIFGIDASDGKIRVISREWWAIIEPSTQVCTFLGNILKFAHVSRARQRGGNHARARGGATTSATFIPQFLTHQSTLLSTWPAFWIRHKCYKAHSTKPSLPQELRATPAAPARSAQPAGKSRMLRITNSEK